ATGTDHGDGESREGDVPCLLQVDVGVRVRLDPHVVEDDVGRVQDRIECGGTACRHLIGPNGEHTCLGDDGDVVGTVAVEHAVRGAAEQPAVRVAYGGDTFVDGGARTVRLRPAGDERGELGGGGQEGGGVGCPAEFLQDD